MNGQKLTVIDRAFKLLDGPTSPQDFTLILHFSNPLDVAGLQAGAKSAGEHFGVEANIETRAILRNSVNKPFDLHFGYPIKQLVIGATLATRFHHAAADGLSAAMWLGHQLSVASGLPPPTIPVALSLKRAAASVRRSKFAYDGACDRLWTPNVTRTGTRRWTTFSFPSTDLQTACRASRRIHVQRSVGDMCAQRYSRRGTSDTPRTVWPRVGLWLPMNIRSRSFASATARAEFVVHYPSTASLAEKTREVRRQISWTTEHGEWAVPNFPFNSLTGLDNRACAAPLFESSIDRYGDGRVLACVDRWGGASNAFKHVERIECVGLLHPRQTSRSMAPRIRVKHGLRLPTIPGYCARPMKKN